MEEICKLPPDKQQEIIDSFLAQKQNEDLTIDPNIKNQPDRALQSMEVLRLTLNKFFLRCAEPDVHGALKYPSFYYNIGAQIKETAPVGFGTLSYVTNTQLNFPKKNYVYRTIEGEPYLFERMETLFNLMVQVEYVAKVARLQNWVASRYYAQRRLLPITTANSNTEFQHLWELNRKALNPDLDCKILMIGGIRDNSSFQSPGGALGDELYTRASLEITINYVDVNEITPASCITCENMPNINLSVSGRQNTDPKKIPLPPKTFKVVDRERDKDKCKNA